MMSCEPMWMKPSELGLRLGAIDQMVVTGPQVMAVMTVWIQSSMIGNVQGTAAMMVQLPNAYRRKDGAQDILLQAVWRKIGNW